MSIGSIEPQPAAASTTADAHRSSASVARERSDEMQFEPATQASGRFHPHAPHPPTMAKALMDRSGTRHSTSNSRLPKKPAPAPTAASPSGTTQQEEAITAPRPANRPSAPSHLGVAGATEGGEAVGVVRSVAWFMAMARPSAMVGLAYAP